MDGEDRIDRHPILDVRLLGGFEVRVGGRAVPASVWGQRRAAAIVKLLALEAGLRIHREQLLDLLWPDLDPDNAANNLRVALHHARRGLEQAGAPPGRFLAREGDVLVLGPQESVLVDVEGFSRAAAAAWRSADPESAEAAAALYGGELLPDDPYEEWAAARREAYRASYLALLARLAGLYEARHDLAGALGARERALAVDVLDEATNAAIVRLHAALGQQETALAHYARFAARLQRELGVAPERETRALAAAVKEGRIPVAPPPPKPAPPTPTLAISGSIPAAVDTVVGRERELAELEKVLGRARLVTLTGPGGVGKTRLAMEAARAVAGRYSSGTAYVDLSAARDPGLVLPAAARVLGVEAAGGEGVGAALAAAIGDRSLLAVFDNLEQVVAAGPDIASLLAACPGLTVLATSRIRLRVRGEQEYPVSPLPLPEFSRDGDGDALVALAESPAVVLFVRRAQAVRPDFRLTADNAVAVAAICRRLDGLPLAIELAAARVGLLAPEALLRLLARPLDALGAAAADLPRRQRTLRDTIAWSYDLLSPDEQRLFRRLSVFPGGWTLEAVEAVGGIDPVLDVLDGLVHQSLAIARRGGADDAMRYAMLETIREFAAEQLAASGEAADVQRARDAFMIRLADDAEQGFLGPQQAAWLDRIQAEHDNIRVVLGAALQRGDAETALALAPSVAPFWRARGFAAEGADWLERALAAAPDGPAERRAAALDALGGLAIDLGEYRLADRAYQASVDLWVVVGDRRAMMQGLFALSIARSHGGAGAEAWSALQESLGIARELHDERGIAAALHNMGMLAREDGDLEQAISLLDEAMSIWRRLGDAHWLGVTAGNLGDVYRLAGDVERARVWLDESARRYASLGDRFGLGVVANQRGLLEQGTGRPSAAMERHAEALRHFDAVDAPVGVIEAIEWLAVAAAGTVWAAEALRLFGAAAEARAARELAPLPADAAPVADGFERATQAVGAGAEAARLAGAALSLDEAREAALALADAAERDSECGSG